jgi:hypothetical protein
LRLILNAFVCVCGFTRVHLQAQSVIAAISNSSTQVWRRAGLGGLVHICMFGVAHAAAAAAAAADYVAV